MGAGHVSAGPIHPYPFRHSHQSWAQWGSRVWGMRLLAGGRFSAGGWAWPTLCSGAGPVVDVAASDALTLGQMTAAEPGVLTPTEN